MVAGLNLSEDPAWWRMTPQEQELAAHEAGWSLGAHEARTPDNARPSGTPSCTPSSWTEESPPTAVHGLTVQGEEPRLPTWAMDELDKAAALADLNPKTRAMAQMRLVRAISAGKLPDAAVQEHAQAKMDVTGGESLTFLKKWAHGLIPYVDQRVTTVTSREESEDWGWFNWNELMHHLGGWNNWEQRKYVDSVWKGAKGWTRPHPQRGLPAQRLCWAKGTEQTARKRARLTGLRGEGELEGGTTACGQMIEALERPSTSQSSWQGWNEEEPAVAKATGDKKEEAGKEAGPPNLVWILGELYKLIPKLQGMHGACSSDTWGEAAKTALGTELSKLKGLRDRLEDNANPVQSKDLVDAKEQLQAALALEKRVHKSGVLR